MLVGKGEKKGFKNAGRIPSTIITFDQLPCK